MRSLDIGASDFPVLPGSAARVVGQGQAEGGAGFGALYRQLNQEVSRFIEQGEGATVLQPEGQWRRLQLGTSVVAGGQPIQDQAIDASQQAFVDAMLPLAREAASRLGVAPEVLTAQAALETGWGRAQPRHADGSSSHNLFGIKAGAGWTGEVVQALTTEVEQGRSVQRREPFRSYADPAQSFQDLARLVSGSPRYQAALGSGADAHAYGQALQRGGYATDPAYADKLAQLAGRIAAQRSGGTR
jgi:flagellar protein FlgJ